MLQNIRQNVNGFAAKVIIGLIIFTFAIFGVESILVGGSSNSAAQVNGEEVSQGEVQQLVQTQVRRLMQMMGEQFNPALIDEQTLRSQALEALIGRKLLIQDADKKKLAIPQAMTNEMITSMEQFQIDGRFSRELYTNTLSSAGLTPAGFSKSLSDDLLVNQLRAGYIGTDFVTPAEVEQAARTSREARDIRYFTLPIADIAKSMTVSDEDVTAFYEIHQEDYRTNENVDVDYIEVRRDDFVQPVSEDALREAFELEKDAQRVPAQRRVSHILFQQAEGESDSALNARVAKVQEALANGADFAEQAKLASDDKGSGAFGGDLGYTTGSSLPAAMEAAVAAQALNVVSEPVVTEAGVHLIKVTDIQEERSPTFDEMRDDIEQRLQNSAASRELLRVVESLRDAVYNAEDLAQPAQELALKVSQANGISRAQDQGVFAQPQLQQQLFSEDVYTQGHNSEVVELNENHYVVARIRTVHAAEIKPLQEVKDAVTQRLKTERATADVAQKARAALVALSSGQSLEAVAEQYGQDWQVSLGALRSNLEVPADVLSRAFSLPLPGAEGAVADTVMSANGDAHVVQLVKVTQGTLVGNATITAELSRELSSEQERLLDTEFQNGLRTRADISVAP